MERQPIVHVGDDVSVKILDDWGVFAVVSIDHDGHRFTYALSDNTGVIRVWRERELRQAMNGISPW